MYGTWSPVRSALNRFNSFCTLFTYYAEETISHQLYGTWSLVMSGLNWFHSICTLFTYLCWRHVPGVRSCPVLTGSILFVHYLPTYSMLEKSCPQVKPGVRFELIPFYLYTIYLPTVCWRSHVHKLYLESGHVRFELVPEPEVEHEILEQVERLLLL